MYRRIPLTRGATLEEAEAAIRLPPVVQALFPFRVASEEDDRDKGTLHRPSRSREVGQRLAGASWHGGTATQGREGFTGADGIRSRPAKPDTSGNHGQPGTSASTQREEDPTRKKGIARPHRSKEAQKYSASFAGKPVELLLTKYMERNKSFAKDPDHCRTCLGLVGASLARNTWKRYNTALRQWESFKRESGTVVDLLDSEMWEKKFLI